MILCADDGVAELEPLSEDAMNAMRWASKLPNDCTVVELVRALPHDRGRGAENCRGSIAILLVSAQHFDCHA